MVAPLASMASLGERVAAVMERYGDEGPRALAPAVGAALDAFAAGRSTQLLEARLNAARPRQPARYAATSGRLMLAPEGGAGLRLWLVPDDAELPAGRLEGRRDGERDAAIGCVDVVHDHGQLFEYRVTPASLVPFEPGARVEGGGVLARGEEDAGAILAILGVEGAAQTLARRIEAAWPGAPAEGLLALAQVFVSSLVEVEAHPVMPSGDLAPGTKLTLRLHLARVEAGHATIVRRVVAGLSALEAHQDPA